MQDTVPTEKCKR